MAGSAEPSTAANPDGWGKVGCNAKSADNYGKSLNGSEAVVERVTNTEDPFIEAISTEEQHTCVCNKSTFFTGLRSPQVFQM